MFQFLQVMLEDRSSNVDSVKAMGAELTSQADEAEKQQIEEQLVELTTRWDKLTEAANARQGQVDAMVAASKVYHDIQEPFLEWLERADKKAASLDVISSDPEKIEQQLDKARVRGCGLLYKM
jgi:hypothetical protein